MKKRQKGEIVIGSVVMLLFFVAGLVGSFVALKAAGDEQKAVSALQTELARWDRLYHSEMRSTPQAPDLFDQLRTIQDMERRGTMQVAEVQVNSRSRQSANAVGNTLTSLMQEESRCKRDYGAQQFATSTEGRVKKIQAANCVRTSLRAQIRIRQAAYNHYMQLKDDVKPPTPN